MNKSVDPETKRATFEALGNLLSSKLDEAFATLAAATEARNSDTKSSAGDKHETGRAMMQIEVDNAARQVQKIRLLKSEFDQIDFKSTGTTIESGSYVITNTMSCIISIGIGRLPKPFDLCFAISLASPMGSALLGKRKGDKFVLQGKEIGILDVL